MNPFPKISIVDYAMRRFAYFELFEFSLHSNTAHLLSGYWVSRELDAIQRLKGKLRTLTYPTSDTDDPINTKICMVDYVGDMMKPYQNGVDRIQVGVYTDMQHITKSFRFSFRFYFHQEAHSPNGWSDFDG
jgi:hypothetical protein